MAKLKTEQRTISIDTDKIAVSVIKLTQHSLLCLPLAFSKTSKSSDCFYLAFVNSLRPLLHIVSLLLFWSFFSICGIFAYSQFEHNNDLVV